jgi:hypothetical protein
MAPLSFCLSLSLSLSLFRLDSVRTILQLSLQTTIERRCRDQRGRFRLSLDILSPRVWWFRCLCFLWLSCRHKRRSHSPSPHNHTLFHRPHLFLIKRLLNKQSHVNKGKIVNVQSNFIRCLLQRLASFSSLSVSLSVSLSLSLCLSLSLGILKMALWWRASS